MKRRIFVGAAFSGAGLTGAYAKPPKPKSGDIPMKEFGKTGVKVPIIAQGGARMDLHPTVQDAAAHVRRVYNLGVTYFDCVHSYWNGKSEEAFPRQVENALVFDHLSERGGVGFEQRPSFSHLHGFDIVHAQSFTGETRALWDGVKGHILKSAEKMPEENYSFKPSPGVRSFGQILGHVADSCYQFCSSLHGETKASDIEKTKTKKADSIAAQLPLIATRRIRA